MIIQKLMPVQNFLPQLRFERHIKNCQQYKISVLS